MTSQISVSPPLWRWAIEDDEPQTGTEDELIRQLASGRLPPYALVWREGWGEWLPAMQVEELSDAFPIIGAIGTRTARPSSIPGVPPVPVSEYPRLRHLAKEAPLGWPDGFEYREQDVITSEVPAAVMKEAARVMTEPSPPIDLGLSAAIERASFGPEELTPYYVLRDEDLTPQSKPALPLAAEYGLQALLDESVPRKNWPFWWRANGLWVALFAIALGLGATFGLRWFGELRDPRPASALVPAADLATAQGALQTPHAASASPASAQSASSTSSAALAAAATLTAAAPAPAPSTRTPALGCRFRHPPLQLDDWAVVDVRPVIRTLPGTNAVAVGYAESHRSASGGTLDLDSLQLARQFWQQDDHQIYSVTPLARAGADKLAFHVERQGSSVAFGRALDTVPPLRVGMNDDGVVIGPVDQRSQKLWELPLGAMMTVPEVAEHPLGITLAARAGRSVGHVRVGLLGADGQSLSALAELGEADRDYGRPGLASGPDQTALAVGRRADVVGPSALFLGRAPNGKLPTQLVEFPVPGNAGPELLAPVLAALPDGRFALMWSQGEGNRRQVRLQTLSAALEPEGPTFDVTAPDPALGAATAAAVHWAGDRLLAFYFVRRDDGHSLWVGSIGCG